jgi:uncharacterized pyridoxal phosphate-containing UPF0001 family protein
MNNNNGNDPNLKDRLSRIRERISQACARSRRPEGSVRLIAVTKNHPAQTAQDLIDLGVRDIGENRVQEIEAKAPALSGDFTLHMIGHLQTNKAQKVWPLAGWIQSVDREKLVRRLEGLYDGGSGGQDNGRQNAAPTGMIDGDGNSLTIGGNGNSRMIGGDGDTRMISGDGDYRKKVLVEVNTSGETSKSGCMPEECGRLCDIIMESRALELKGLMTIGPLGGDEAAVRRAFALLRELSLKCCTGIKAPELSMGMSGDFEWAIEEGATMVRVGTALAGSR